jgi:hypothetical protein
MGFNIERTDKSVTLDETFKSSLREYQTYNPLFKYFLQLCVEPLCVEPLSVEPLSVEPLCVEPLSVEPLCVEPLCVEPTLIYPTVIDSIHSTTGYSEYIGHNNMTSQSIPMFVKFCPLFDTTKVFIGKASIDNLSLPSHQTPDHQFACKNNSAYVDSFFAYLTSHMLHDHGFLNALDSYGSLLAIKKDFRVDISDDIEYLFESEYFLENRGEFNISDEIYEQFEPVQSCKYKRKLEISDTTTTSEIIIDVDNIEEIIPNSTIDFTECYNNESDLIYIKKPLDDNKGSSHNTNSSSCSSRSSITTADDDSADDDDGDGSDDSDGSDGDEDSSDGSDGSDGSYYSESEEDIPICATIDEFPVNMVFLEACRETLDDYTLHNDVSQTEWSAIFMQIVMTLTLYQEKFYFIHNDLHNSNIMYVDTNKKYLYYKYNDIHYKVPTFGKIWKIIDFGRAIYKFKGTVVFSDSFSTIGDASTQYNCEPYLNPKKSIVPPNFSFDLCRLACSLYDYFDEMEDMGDIQALIEDWVKDDKGRNILYKMNGDERYPEFKLYKMITRKVHHTIPKDQLSRPIFSQYSISKKNIKKKHTIMVFDDIPSYVV